jgi:hypothetical protein
MPRRRKGLAVAGSAAVAVLLALGACAGDDDEPDVATPSESRSTETTAESEASASTDASAPEEGTSLVGLAKGDSISVWTTPNEADEPARALRAADEPNGQIVMLVKQELGPTWLEVYLPSAPPGSSGWVRRRDVDLSRHRFRIEVARSSHTLTVYAGEVSAVETPVAIGPDAPQPTTGLYIKSLLEPADATGPYGRYAYGLSGASSRAENFESGSGLVAIHGAGDASTLGADAGSGSLAIDGEELNRLVSSIGLPLGTPVEIVD